MTVKKWYWDSKLSIWGNLVREVAPESRDFHRLTHWRVLAHASTQTLIRRAC